MPPRNDFLSQQAPENYVAGLGRGATGFTTRSDLGPAREGPSEDQIKEALAKRAAQLGTDPSSFGGAAADDKKDDGPEDDDRFQDPDNETGLFASGNYDRDDDEADRIYQEVDERMDKRRRARREAREQAERDDYERKNPKIQQQFADLKRSLGAVTDEEWAAIPEVGDLTGKNKRTKQQQQRRFYAVPDSVLANANNSAQFENNVQEDGTATNGESADGAATNFADIGRARDKVLQVRLDQAAQADAADSSANGGTSTSVDPKGYLTSLSKSLGGQGEYQLGDIKRVRSLLENVIKTNPKHAPGWIAAARVEEVAGKHVAARNVIARGCEQCPKSEDAWLENIRLNDKYNARIIAANALKNNDRSVRLWVEAMRLEDEPRAKKRVLRQALDHVPQSVAIWKEAVNLETDPGDARLMLHKATEIVPLSVELWLALARLETADNAQKVLNKARKAIPTSHEIWIAASRLQEQIGEPTKVDMLMKRAVLALAKETAMLKRDDWIQEAEKCEAEGAIQTCGAIIRETIGFGLDEDDDRRELWMGDARDCILRGNFETARAIYSHTLQIFPTSKNVWQAAVDLEKNHGKKEALWATFDRATNAVPKAAELWMQHAREKWSTGDVGGARVVLGKAFSKNPDNEDIWLCAVELEIEADNAQQVRKLLGDARDEAGTDRVWIKSAAFERSQGETTTALNLVSDGLARFPKAAKLHMIKGQIYEHDMSPPRLAEAREAYTAGTRACPQSVPLWLMAARLEEREGILVKARSVLDRARLANPKNATLWVESVRIERRAGKDPAAKQLMARALQEVPRTSAGPLWAERIWHLEARNQRKNLALEAIKKVESDATLFVSVARIFWAERRLDKAASWFEKAVLLDPDVGDTWAWYVKFLRQHGTAEKIEDVITKCVLNKPRHGEVWQRVNKEVGNATKSVEQVLNLVIAQLEL